MSVTIFRKVNDKLVQAIELDVTLSHEIGLDSMVTEHNVEAGAAVTDNIRTQPVKFTMTALTSETRIRLLGLLGGGARDEERKLTAYEALRDIRNNKELVIIQDELDRWVNMAVESISIPRDKSTFHAFQFTATFKQVNLVGVERVSIKDEPKAQTVATKAADDGKKTTTEATEEDKSLAIGIIGAERLDDIGLTR